MSESKRVRLRAPQGTDEASLSGYAPFKINSETRIVEVPVEAVEPLVQKGGFVQVDVPKAEPASDLVPVMHSSDPTGSCNYGSPDANGIIMVPAHAVADLIPHGFVPVTEYVPAAEAAPAAPEPKKTEEAPAKAADAKGK